MDSNGDILVVNTRQCIPTMMGKELIKWNT